MNLAAITHRDPSTDSLSNRIPSRGRADTVSCQYGTPPSSPPPERSPRDSDNDTTSCHGVDGGYRPTSRSYKVENLVSPVYPHAQRRPSSEVKDDVQGTFRLTEGHKALTVLDIVGQDPAGGHVRIVPQRKYYPPRGYRMGDTKTYEPIMFYLKNPDHIGISCKDALYMVVTRLVDRDAHVLEGCGPAVSLRFMWPGYPAWSRQIPTRDFKSRPEPITRARLAKNVARTVQLFMADMNTRVMDSNADKKWRIGGSNGITFDDLELLGLEHVSLGSWQVHLRLKSKH